MASDSLFLRIALMPSSLPRAHPATSRPTSHSLKRASYFGGKGAMFTRPRPCAALAPHILPLHNHTQTVRPPAGAPDSLFLRITFMPSRPACQVLPPHKLALQFGRAGSISPRPCATLAPHSHHIHNHTGCPASHRGLGQPFCALPAGPPAPTARPAPHLPCAHPAPARPHPAPRAHLCL